MQQQNKLGFTLIECLVALLIIAIVLASATKAIGSSINDVRDSYVREVATWVVENQYNQFYLDSAYPELGTSKKDVSMADIDLTLTTIVSTTPNPYFRKLEIEVSEKKNPSYIVFKTINFVSQY